MADVHVDVEGRTLKLSNLDKVLYPRTGTTKGEVLHYYAQVAPALLPHLADRAVTRIRWPHGVERSSFFEKNAPAGTPSWVRTAEVPTTGSRSGKGEGAIRFPICDDLATLTWLANLAALELHVHQWTVDSDGTPRDPDRLVIDGLSEPGIEWRTIELRNLLDFFHHPTRYFIQKRLGIFLQEGPGVLESREPFTLEALPRYRLRQTVLQQHLQGEKPASMQKFVRAAGLLPPIQIGTSRRTGFGSKPRLSKR